jgi:hypothetical protein
MTISPMHLTTYLNSPTPVPRNLQITQRGWEDVLDCPGRTLHSGNSAFLTLSNEPAPTSYSKAMQSQDNEEWSAAILQELMSLEQRGTFTIVPKSSVPKDRQPIGSKWVFENKYDLTG